MVKKETTQDQDVIPEGYQNNCERNYISNLDNLSTALFSIKVEERYQSQKLWIHTVNDQFLPNTSNFYQNSYLNTLVCINATYHH